MNKNYAANGIRLAASCWDSPARAHIKQASEAMNSSPEALLHTVLIRVSATTLPSVMVNTVIDQPASLNVISALIGPPGTGKGRAIRHAAKLLPFSAENGPEELGLTTGEGLIEAYIGEDELTGERVQVYDKAFAATTEAAVLAQCVSRSGNTLQAHLCSAWMGEALITSTADVTRRRKIFDNQYRFSAVMAAQPDVADAFLSSGYLGLPQRIAWTPSTRERGTRVPLDQRPLWPGELTANGESMTTWLDGLGNIELVLPDAAVIELEAIAEDLEDGRGEERPLDTHEPLWKSKYAALLALLDGETEISMGHWHLASALWDASCAQRDLMVKEADGRRRTQRAAEAEQRVHLGANIRQAQRMVDEGAPHPVRQVALRMARKVVQSEHPLTAADLKTTANSTNKKNAETAGVKSLIQEARMYAVVMGWIEQNNNGRWVPGMEEIPDSI